jgi:hypothetical protein
MNCKTSGTSAFIRGDGHRYRRICGDSGDSNRVSGMAGWSCGRRARGVGTAAPWSCPGCRECCSHGKGGVCTQVGWAPCRRPTQPSRLGDRCARFHGPSRTSDRARRSRGRAMADLTRRLGRGSLRLARRTLRRRANRPSFCCRPQQRIQSARLSKGVGASEQWRRLAPDCRAQVLELA